MDLKVTVVSQIEVTETHLCNTFSSILASWIRIRKIMWINGSKPKFEKLKKDRAIFVYYRFCT